MAAAMKSARVATASSIANKQIKRQTRPVALVGRKLSLGVRLRPTYRILRLQVGTMPLVDHSYAAQETLPVSVFHIAFLFSCLEPCSNREIQNKPH